LVFINEAHDLLCDVRNGYNADYSIISFENALKLSSCVFRTRQTIFKQAQPIVQHDVAISALHATLEIRKNCAVVKTYKKFLQGIDYTAVERRSFVVFIDEIKNISSFVLSTRVYITQQLRRAQFSLLWRKRQKCFALQKLCALFLVK
jgi:hypothetical protein